MTMLEKTKRIASLSASLDEIKKIPLLSTRLDETKNYLLSIRLDEANSVAAV